MFTQILKLIRILSSETAPIQISAGFALAMIIGFTPLLSVHNLIVLLMVLFFRVNLAAFIFGWAVFSGAAYLLDPVFQNLGQTILTQPDLSNVWTDMYNSSVWRLTQFNNTLVMGSLLVSLIAFIPMLLLGNFLINHYRNDVLKYMNNSRLFKVIKNSKLFSKFISLAE